ncbi:PAS domain-containing protein [Peribacillus frigoritolerans]|uniref:PAS domain-containing protein n=1 Tax=Peribacillus frigoritolerans TaxID=450367 RepID=UPI003F7FAB52
MNRWKKTVLEQIRVGIIAIDRNYRITYVNEGAASIDIYSSAVLGLSIFEVFENLKENDSSFVRVIKTGEVVAGSIQTFITCKGVLRTAITSTYPIIEDNKVIGAYELFEDISAVTRLSEELTALRTSKMLPRKYVMKTMNTKENVSKLLEYLQG